MQRAASLNDLGRYDEALHVLNNPELLQADGARTCYLQGVAWERLERWQEAVNAYTGALEHNPTYADALNNRAVVYGRLDQLDLAIADLEQTVSLNPDDALAWSNLGLAYHQLGDFEKAIVNFDEAAARSPDVFILLNRGLAWFAKGELSKAIEDFSLAIAEDEQFTEAYVRRAVAHTLSGNREAALLDLENASRFDINAEWIATASQLREAISKSNLHDLARRRLAIWLTSLGFECQLSNERFLAKRLPPPSSGNIDATGDLAPPAHLENASDFDSELPDRFSAVVAIQRADGEILVEAPSVKVEEGFATQCLFVLNATQLAAESTAPNSSTPGELPALIRVDYNWKWIEQTVKPFLYRLEGRPRDTSLSDRSSGQDTH